MTDEVGGARGQVGLHKELTLLEMVIIGLVGAGILFSSPKIMIMSGPLVVFSIS